MFLQSFGQQMVQAGDHGPGIVVQARSDHGVVIDLQRGSGVSRD